MNKRARIFWIIATIIVMAVIFWFSSQNASKSLALSDTVAETLHIEQKETTTRVSDQGIFMGLTLRKIAHIVLFAVLGFCLNNSLTGIKGRILYAVGGGYLYAVIDELHQSVSGRQGRWQDTLIDLIGLVIGIMGSWVITAIWKRVKREDCR